MHTTHLRKVGGSVMLSVPPAILEILHLQAGAEVGVTVEGNRLIVEAQRQKRYSLEELLAQCDASQPLVAEDEQEWVNGAAIGGELV
jgi:antitoxin ChpS